MHPKSYISKRRRALHKVAEKQKRKEWLTILKDKPVINIFHIEKYNRDLIELSKI